MTEKQANFRAMTEASKEDWGLIAEHMTDFMRDLPVRLVTHLELLRGDYGGYPVDRLEHCLQTATRALRDGRDEEYVVCALLHDIGDTLGPANHADVAAVILEPYVSEENHWIIKHHGIFQGYYFFQHVGLDRDAREAFRGKLADTLRGKLRALFGEAEVENLHLAFIAQHDVVGL